MKMNFCTLFDSGYLSRGFLMYQSLLENCRDFHLYVFAFDNNTLDFLKNENPDKLTVVSLTEFEDNELLRIKTGRSRGEYCWTCTSSTILYSIEKFGLDHCTYIDADMYFYSDPRVLVEEMNDKSVLITEHRYSPEYDQSLESGKYCVQFVTFKNTECGMKVLRWWRNACIDWCYNRIEDGKFGDQKYLDDWTQRFECVHVLKNHGGGIAPWNVQQYSFCISGNKISGKELSTGQNFSVVFFHFHGLRFFSNNVVALSGEVYELDEIVRRVFYFPYIKKLNETKKSLAAKVNFDSHGTSGISKFGSMNFIMMIKYYINDLKFSFRNILGKSLKYRRLHHHFYNNRHFE